VLISCNDNENQRHVKSLYCAAKKLRGTLFLMLYW